MVKDRLKLDVSFSKYTLYFSFLRISDTQNQTPLKINHKTETFNEPAKHFHLKRHDKNTDQEMYLKKSTHTCIWGTLFINGNTGLAPSPLGFARDRARSEMIGRDRIAVLNDAMPLHLGTCGLLNIFKLRDVFTMSSDVPVERVFERCVYLDDCGKVKWRLGLSLGNGCYEGT